VIRGDGSFQHRDATPRKRDFTGFSAPSIRPSISPCQIQPLPRGKTLTASVFALYKACHWRRAQTLPPLFFGIIDGIIDFRNGFQIFP